MSVPCQTQTKVVNLIYMPCGMKWSSYLKIRKIIIHLRTKINSDEVISRATKGSSVAIQDLKGL